MVNTLRHFSGEGPAKDKLNELVDAVNMLLNIRGDENFIAVRRGTAGVTVSLNIDQVAPRIPKHTGGGGYGKFMIVTACSKTWGIATVRPLLGDVTIDSNGNLYGVADTGVAPAFALNGVEGWHETGDIVAVIPFVGRVVVGTEPWDLAWVVVPHVRGLGLYVYPDESELSETQDDPDQRLYCGGLPGA